MVRPTRAHRSVRGASDARAPFGVRPTRARHSGCVRRARAARTVPFEVRPTLARLLVTVTVMVTSILVYRCDGNGDYIDLRIHIHNDTGAPFTYTKGRSGVIVYMYSENITRTLTQQWSSVIGIGRAVFPDATARACRTHLERIGARASDPPRTRCGFNLGSNFKSWIRIQSWIQIQSWIRIQSCVRRAVCAYV